MVVTIYDFTDSTPDLTLFREQIKIWKTAKSSFDNAKSESDGKITRPIHGGAWEGESGTAANQKAAKLGTELKAASTEAESIGWILWRGADLLDDSKKKILALKKQVEDDPDLDFSDGEGTISIRPPTGRTGLVGETAEMKYNRLLGKKTQLESKIFPALREARLRDSAIARALLGASNMDDDPYQPNFNGNAPKDGWIDVSDSVPSKTDYYATALRILGEPGEGTPAQQSAEIGDRARKMVEAAGGVCKLVDGLMVCVGAPPYMYNRGGSIYGDTFVSKYGDFDSFELDHQGKHGGLIDHEKYHRDQQWRKGGHGFGRSYVWEEQRAIRGDFTNKYEVEAEEKGGKSGYTIDREIDIEPPFRDYPPPKTRHPA